MSDTTAVRQIKVGRIVGLSAYELAVKNGTFTGSEEDFAKMVTTNQDQFDSINKAINDLKKGSSSEIQDQLNSINQEIDELKKNVDASMKEQIQQINTTISQIQEKLNKINQQIPDNISISTNETKDDIIFNVK